MVGRMLGLVSLAVWLEGNMVGRVLGLLYRILGNIVGAIK